MDDPGASRMLVDYLDLIRAERESRPAEAMLLDEIERLRGGLRRIAHQDYDAGWYAEDYAGAVLSGDEPSEEETVHDA